MRAIGHITGASINTTTKLLSDAADAAVAYDAEKTRGIKGYRHIQCDEIWSFVYAKQGTVPYAKSARTMPAIPGRSRPWIPKAR